MNPEDNNPLTNPGASGFGGNDNPFATSGTDSFAVPGSSTSTQGGLGVSGLDTSTSTPGMAATDAGATTNPDFQPAEEPLTPAAPVPGSIGSVTSVPPAPAEPLANPFAPTSDTPAADGATTSGPMAAPEVTPTATPYNPFATPSTSTGTTAKAEPAGNLNPSFQPAVPVKTAAKKSASNGLLTTILAIATGLFLITTIVFLVLFINAKNNEKIVYVPTEPDGSANATLQILTCTHEEDFAWLVEADHPIIGQSNAVISYSDGKVSGASNEIVATFDNEDAANLARDTYSGLLSLSALSDKPLDVVSSVDGTTLRMTVSPQEKPLTEATAAAFIYDNESEGQSTTLDAVKAHAEANGSVCTVE